MVGSITTNSKRSKSVHCAFYLVITNLMSMIYQTASEVKHLPFGGWSLSNTHAIARNQYCTIGMKPWQSNELDEFPCIVINTICRAKWARFCRRQYVIHFEKKNRRPYKSSPIFVPGCLMNDISILDQVMAWRSANDNQLPELMMASPPAHTWVTKLRWVRYHVFIFCYWIETSPGFHYRASN